MRRARANGGFTLVETMTALFVFATAALGLSLLNRDSVSSARFIRAKVLARTVAENQAVLVMLQQRDLERGFTRGAEEQMGVRFEWTRTISESPRDGLLLVEIDVREEEADLVLAQLTTLRAER